MDEQKREYQSNYIASQTDEQTADRVDKQREYQSNYIDSQTEEQTAERLDKKREYQFIYIDLKLTNKLLRAKFKANLELRDLVYNLTLSCKRDVCISAVSCSLREVRYSLCLSSLIFVG